MSTVHAGSYRVVIAAAGRHDDADRLDAELEDQARRSGGTRAVIEATRDLSVFDADPDPGDATTALVILGGSGAATDPATANAARRCQKTLRTCLPVFDPAGAFTDQLPTDVHELNGVEWPAGDGPARVVAEVLRLLGISEDERRVFLSYRRSDGSALAQQLRYALIDSGWDVFLDRFSVPPAVKFQKRLYRDLADKGFVLVLETPDAANSSWVEHEITFAHTHRLGIMSLKLPETTQKQLVPAVLEDLRVRLAAADLNGPATARTLTESALARMLQIVDERHAQAYQQRREILMLESDRELRRRGYAVTPIGHWQLLATRGKQDEVVLATARAPEAADLLAVESLRARTRLPGRVSRGWVVHPLEDIDPDRARLIGWLSRYRRVGPSPLMMLGSRLGA
jgi:TIR domain